MNGGSSEFRSFHDFYPFYLEQHQDVVCRRLHFTGTALVVLLLLCFLLSLNWIILVVIPLAGYGFAWIG